MLVVKHCNCQLSAMLDSVKQSAVGHLPHHYQRQTLYQSDLAKNSDRIAVMKECDVLYMEML